MEWFEVANIDSIPSPSLLVYPDRIRENIRRMIDIAGGTERLRPHVKTHKMAEVVQLQMEQGINQFKCATLHEAEMCARAGVKDLLIAYQLLGPNLDRYFDLIQKFPDTRFSSIVDAEQALEDLSVMATSRQIKAEVYLDINSGMNRTGVMPGEAAVHLYKKMSESPFIKSRGFHVYDGHIHDRDLEDRVRHAVEEFAAVEVMEERLKKEGFEVPEIVAGGTPTFPVHARFEGRILSPGTPLLWDEGYASSFPDLEFLPAALLLTRVVSRPKQGVICLDLGHKAVASGMVHPRAQFLGLPAYEPVMHSEEHLALKEPSSSLNIGEELLAIPTHICPTVALHSQAYIIENHRMTTQWQIARARN
ncbi:D-TA family PLP-dependent enzyme [Reichenbachiella ulvae]|uniref:D-TA family PLP-dependent enzyme n=1 Tax=Reichenbachiella ulvae TaxID=2980104 RepID=A0ABT3CV69_9BACT|nr:D-TA family PLP-dependent enzyme [Reichenbachiella ulvae]MCV9387595.1 D-TA family PLP-dependent enzyme [Reichenbachiella ulvae]